MNECIWFFIGVILGWFLTIIQTICYNKIINRRFIMGCGGKKKKK